ncbi:MAG: hypothetical protein AAGG79_03425 [Pseudomonadota bacterium]
MTKLSGRVFRLRSGQYCIVPSSDDGRELLEEFRGPKEWMVEIRGVRNIRHHNLYFKALYEIVKSGAWKGDAIIGAPETVEGLLKWVKDRLGEYKNLYVREETDPPRVIVYREYNSINFESMTQEKFNSFFDRSCQVLCRDLLATDQWEKWQAHIVELFEGSRRDPREAA